MRALTILFATATFCMAHAQTTLPYNGPAPFFPANLLALSFLQSSSSEWSQGPQNFLAAKASLRMREMDSVGPLRAVYLLTADIGVRQSNDSADIARVRTGENELFGELRITYPFGWAADPYCSANFRSPMTESFFYSAHPFRTGNLWDPVISYESAGLQYLRCLPAGMLSARGGIALKQTRASDNTLLTDDFLTPAIERFKSETGIEFVGEAILTQDSVLQYSGRVAMFTTFTQFERWTIRWDNELRYRLWRFVGLTIQLQTMYDATQSTRLQYKQGAMISFFAEP